MLGFAKSSTTVTQLATTQQICLLLFSHKKLWSLADWRMVSSRQENGLLYFGYKLHSYPQAISTHGQLFYNGYNIRNNSLQFANRICLIFLQIHLAETIGRMVSRLT
ncbi:hypothetical protein QL285_009869 [Trifolium repens]|nr:hypothetical protein QL285_009869 [Trifolium repens]